MVHIPIFVNCYVRQNTIRTINQRGKPIYGIQQRIRFRVDLSKAEFIQCGEYASSGDGLIYFKNIDTAKDACHDINDVDNFGSKFFIMDNALNWLDDDQCHIYVYFHENEFKQYRAYVEEAMNKKHLQKYQDDALDTHFYPYIQFAI
jgi:hypothetical protein